MCSHISLDSGFVARRHTSVLLMCNILGYQIPAVCRQVCPSTGRPCDCSAGADSGTNSDDKDEMYGSTALKTPTAEPIFPPELRKRTVPELALPGPLAAWYRCAPCMFAGGDGLR